MSDSLDAPAPGALPPPALSLTTPTGLQSIDELTRRRRLVLGLNLITYALMLGWASRILAAGGWTWIDAVLFLAFALGTPWAVLGFWNALIGLWLLNAGGTDARMAVAPFAAAGDQPTPIRIKTAVFMTLRNEDATRAIERFKIVADSIERTGEGGAFSYFVLSDSNDAAVGAAEERAVTAWRGAAAAP
jgi:membrane glycosyltransferase